MSVTHPVGIIYQVEVFWDNAFWYDITADIRALTCETSSRSRLSNTFDPGRLVMQLDNRTRKYDPLYTSGTYYGDLKPGRLVRFRLDSAGAPVTGAFYGTVDRFSLDYDRSNKDATVTITCLDDLSQASWALVPAGTTAPVTAGENAWERLTAIRSAYTYGPDFNDQGGANFVAAMSGQDKWDSSVDHNVLDEVRRTAALEQGVIVANTGGGIDVFDRHWFLTRTKSATSQATIGTGGLPFHDISVLFDADEIITAVAMTDEVGNAVVSIDTAGESEYGTRYPSVTFDRLPALNDEDLEGAANALLALRATETLRVDSLTIKPGSDASWPDEIVSLGLLDRVTVTWTPTGVGSAVTADYFIDGITHQVTPDNWTTVYSLWPAAPFDDAFPAGLFTVDSSLVDGADLIGL